MLKKVPWSQLWVRQLLGATIACGTATAVWANGDDGESSSESRQTRVGVSALANVSKSAAEEGAKPGVQALANMRNRSERAGVEQPHAAESALMNRTREGAEYGRADGAEAVDELRHNGANNRAAGRNRQFGAVGRPFGANQWGGFVPLSHWGFNPNGAVSNRAYRNRGFGFPCGFASGGFGFGYGNPYLVPSYYGFGFSPVAFGLSGPVVVRYDDPLRRQWKQVDDGVRKMAEGR